MGTEVRPSHGTPEQRLDAALQRERQASENYEYDLAAWKSRKLSELHLLVTELDQNDARGEMVEAYKALRPDERQRCEAFRRYLDDQKRSLVIRLKRELVRKFAKRPPTIRPVVVRSVYRERRARPRSRGAGRPRGHTGRRRTCARSGDADPDLEPPELVSRYAKQAGIPPERVLACAGCGVVAVCIDRYQADQLRALGWTAAWCPACWKRMEAKP